MCTAFEKTGFTNVANKINMQTGTGLAAGDVLWKRNLTCMYIGDGEVVIASPNSKDIVIENYYDNSWNKVLRYAD